MNKFFYVFLAICTTTIEPCTTILVTKGATKDGSLLVGHTDDNDLGDQRIVYIAAQDYKKGEKRAVFYNQQTYPRYVGKDRSPFYDIPDEASRKPIGYIEQVEHTYAYIEGNYGIINEHQLSLGECTNATKFYYQQDPQKRIIDIATLSQLAMERCTTAKEAVKLMGEIAEKYGYFGWGETLLVADKNEGWVFEISGTPDGSGALWAAQKVPNGEIFVAANQFRIQDIDPTKEDILFSSNLFALAEKYEWKKENTPLNWLKIVCPGEFDHPYYSLRRVWRVMSRVNPSLKLSPWVEGPYTKLYPFSVQPQKPLAVEDVMALFRDHYEGTEFDMTKGIAAGPYGSPYRYLGNYDTTDFPDKRKTPVEGAWERPISIYYTGYSYVTQIRSYLPDPIGGVSWIGFDNPYTTCYMPLYCGVTSLPSSLQKGNPQKYDDHFAWWPFNIANNWTSYIFSYGTKEIIAHQKKWESQALQAQKDIDKTAYNLFKKDPLLSQNYLTKYCQNQVQQVVSHWHGLVAHLFELFNDGYINKPTIGERVGYPQWYLEAVGYKNGPKSYEQPKESP